MDVVRRAVPARWTGPRPGRLLRNPALAATWRRLLADTAGAGDREARIEAAREVWRSGFIAEALVRQAGRPTLDTSGTRHTGTLTADDLAAWSATYETPTTYDWNGWTVCKAGPWSQGPALLQQLALLPGELPERGSADYVHLLVEGCKLAMADREAWYGDAAPVPLAELLSREYNAGRRALVGAGASLELRPGSPGGRAPRLSAHAHVVADDDPGFSPMGVGEPTVARDGRVAGDTCHIDVVDRWGNLVAATPSGGWLQSNPVVPELGFPLGTRLQMTWLEDGLPNSLTPGRRPRTTLTPSIALRDGVPVLAFGTPGGDQQDQWQLHFFLEVAQRAPVRGGLDLQGAIDAPNWHTDGFPGSFYPRGMRPGSLTVESRTPAAVVEELRRRGHRVTVGPPGPRAACARSPATPRAVSCRRRRTRGACRGTRSGAERGPPGHRVPARTAGTRRRREFMRFPPGVHGPGGDCQWAVFSWRHDREHGNHRRVSRPPFRRRRGRRPHGGRDRDPAPLPAPRAARGRPEDRPARPGDGRRPQRRAVPDRSARRPAARLDRRRRGGGPRRPRRLRRDPGRRARLDRRPGRRHAPVRARRRRLLHPGRAGPARRAARLLDLRPGPRPAGHRRAGRRRLPERRAAARGSARGRPRPGGGHLHPDFTTDEQKRALLRLRTDGVAPRPCGSAGLEYLAVARGLLDATVFSWEAAWDHAAGLLLVEEAGGAHLTLTGEPFRITGGNALPFTTARDEATARRIRGLLTTS